MIRGATNAPGPLAGTRLEHRPGIDGLRALAVSAVVAFHLDRLPGGNLGVDAFFVISGWIITSALLVSVAPTGRARLDLSSFWSARVRRLLPASALTLLVVSVVWTALDINAATLRRDVIYALGWASNWGTITSGGDYWARFGEASPVTHFWSLAVEEQFYLVWPVVLWATVRAGGRAKAVISVSLALAAASIVTMVVLFDPLDPTATYLHTGARAHSLLIGAAAAGLSLLRPRHAWIGGVVRRAALPAVVVALGIVFGSQESSDWLYRWGLPVFALAMAVIVMWVAERPDGGRLGHPVLRWVGDRSYGIYLWHWPVILLIAAPRVAIDGVARDVLCVAVAVALAALSHRLLEQPIRRSPRVTWRWAPGFALGTLAACTLVLGLAPAPPGAELASASVVTLPPEAPADSTTSSTSDTVALRSMARSAPADGDEHVRLAVGGPMTNAVAHTLPLRVLVVGDSTAVHLANELVPQASAPGSQLLVGTAAYPGCGLSAGTDGRLHESTNPDGSSQLNDLTGCTRQWGSIPKRIDDEGIDIVLVQIGAWDGTDVHLPDGDVVSVADPHGRALVGGAYRAFANRVERAGAELVWVLPADLQLGWGKIDTVLDDPARWSALRDIIHALRVSEIDLGGWLTSESLDGPSGRPDGVHLSADAEARFVSEVVIPALMATTAPQAG